MNKAIKDEFKTVYDQFYKLLKETKQSPETEPDSWHVFPNEENEYIDAITFFKSEIKLIVSREY